MENAKKKQQKKVLTWVLLTALVVLLAAMPLLARREAEGDGPVASVLTDTVKTGSIATAIHGGGTLSVPDAENIEIPSDVKITEFLVKNGDYITEGTPIAVVDKVSVMTAITSVTESMEEIHDEIESAREESVSSTIAATAGGRVKVIYAEAGDDVQDVMLRDGALAVLSLDSLMAVKLSGGMAVQPGETVTVTLSDDTEIEGRVESNLNGEIIITVEDEGYPIGEKVTVTTGGGTPMGTGELYVHNQWIAAGVTGTISTVNCKEERKVSSGATLFTLKDTEFESELQYLSSLHREYEELLQRLFRMHETGTIDAPCGGLVSGIDKDSAHLLAAEEAAWEVELLSNDTQNTTEKGWKVVLLSGESLPGDGAAEDDPNACTGNENCTAIGTHRDECPKNTCTLTTACVANPNNHNGTCAYYCTLEPNCGTAYHKQGCLSVCTGNDANCKSERPAKEHLDTCSKRCVVDTSEDKEIVCDSKKHQPACIENCTEAAGCTAINHKSDCPMFGVTYTAWAAKVFQSVNGTVQIYREAVVTSYTVEPTASGWKLVDPTSIDTTNMLTSDFITTDKWESFSQNDIILIISGTKDDDEIFSDIAVYQKGQSAGQQGGMPSFGGLSGFVSAGGYTYAGTVQEIEDDLYPLEGDILATVTPQNTMVLTIAVDEQDISRLSPGMTAQIEVNALKGETFQGTVTRVGISGTNNGGSSKFPVEITMAMTKQVIDGMSATATIGLDTLEDVLTIPVAALNRENNKTVVYTAVSEETGEPSGAVEVETGVSDGISVQILSGLKEGDPICYSYYDQVALDNSVKADKYSFG